MFKIKISGEEFSNFQNFKLTLKFNSIASTFSFDALFDETNERQKTLFRPFGYRKCEIFNDSNKLMLTGVILNHGFKTNEKKNLTSVGGYSVTGVLEDSNISPSRYPLESNGKTVKQIVQTLISDFGISLGEFSADFDSKAIEAVNEVIEKSTSSPTKTIKSYLSDICAQRNLLLTHNAKGQIVITRSNKKKASIRKLASGDYTSISLACNGQKMHDEITVMRQASLENENATQETIRNPFITEFRTDITPKNPFVPNIRPSVKKQDSGQDSTATTAAQNALANELTNITFTIQVPKWEWIKGQMILPDTIVTIPPQPELHIEKEFKLFIETVAFSGTTKSQVSTLSCVLPEVYNGEIPTNIFL